MDYHTICNCGLRKKRIQIMCDDCFINKDKCKKCREPKEKQNSWLCNKCMENKK